MSHPTHEQLEAYSREKHPGEQWAFIEEHLLICEQCRNALTEIDARAS